MFEQVFVCPGIGQALSAMTAWASRACRQLLHGLAIIVEQGHRGLPSPYHGENSMQAKAMQRNTLSTDLMFGRQLGLAGNVAGSRIRTGISWQRVASAALPAMNGCATGPRWRRKFITPGSNPRCPACHQSGL